MGKKYYDLFIELLNNIRDNNMTREELSDYVISNIDPEYILNEEDSLSSDVYFSIKHFASGEEDFTLREIQYLLQCLKGERNHSFEDREKGNID